MVADRPRRVLNETATRHHAFDRRTAAKAPGAGGRCMGCQTV